VLTHSAKFVASTNSSLPKTLISLPEQKVEISENVKMKITLIAGPRIIMNDYEINKKHLRVYGVEE
jgi:hypothetical protein